MSYDIFLCVKIQISSVCLKYLWADAAAKCRQVHEAPVHFYKYEKGTITVRDH